MEPDEATDEVLAPDVEETDQTEADDAGEASEEEQAEPQESEESEPGGDSEPVFAVTIDGKEVQLSRSEIEKGMMLHKAFTQKTQAHAENVRQWDAAVAQARETLSRELDTVKGWLEFYQANQPPEPNWAELAEKSPAEYVRAKAKWDAEAAKRTQAQDVYKQIRQREERAADEQFLAAMQQEFPEWAADDALADKELAETWVAAGQYGFSREDVLAARNPKVFRVLRDAAAYRQLQSKKTEVQARVIEAPKKPPVKSPGTPERSADAAAKAAFLKRPTHANALKLDF